MNTRNQIVGTYLVKISIAVLILLVGGFLYLRQDVSRGKTYSLNPQSRQTARDLREDVRITIYASRNLPLEFNTLRRSLKDLLDEYERVSNGKIRYSYASAENNEKLGEQAAKNNIMLYSWPSQGDEGKEMQPVVFGVTLEKGDVVSAMTLFPGMEHKLEYQFTKIIARFDTQHLPDLLVFGDSLNMATLRKYYGQELNAFRNELFGNYNLLTTNLDSLPRSAPVMLFMGVTDSLSTRQLYNLDQYLMRGGKLVMAQDRVKMLETPQGEIYLENESNIFSLLEHYGVLIRPNIVLDRNSAKGKGDGLGSEVPYPYAPIVRGNQSKIYTKGFDQVMLVIASQITPTPGSRLKIEPVMQTSEYSNVLIGPVFQIRKVMEQGLDPTTLSMPPLTVAAEVSGMLKSYFAPGSALALLDSLYQPSTEHAQFILFADNELPLDRTAGTYIVVNALDYLMGRYDMIELRSRNPQFSYLGTEVYMYKHKIDLADPKPLKKTLKLVFQATAILLPMILLVLMGSILAFRRASALILRIEAQKKEGGHDA